MGDSFVVFWYTDLVWSEAEEKFIEKCMQIRYAKPKIVA